LILNELQLTHLLEQLRVASVGWSPCNDKSGGPHPSDRRSWLEVKDQYAESSHDQGDVAQEASLIVGLSKPPANRHLVWLCELLKLCAFLFSSTLAHSTRLELEK
jgi:hypothetical protein